jgi:hypothetical protein
MDHSITWLASAAAPDSAGRALLEIDAAIALVAGGAAIRVRIACLADVETVAIQGAARAQAAGLAFRLQRETSGPLTVVVGPRLAEERSAGSR